MNYILHIDEIFLKGANQRFFYRTLMDNLRALFPRAFFHRKESGIWVENLTSDDENRLSLVPGIANFAVAIKGKCDMESIKKMIDKFLSLTPRNDATFRVTVERSCKQSALTSAQIAKEAGSYVNQKTGWKVNLKNFDVKINIAVGKNDAFAFGNPIDGAGGLPTGSSGKILCLLSGGIDSPVAAYKMMCRGAEVELIHFQNKTLSSQEVGEKIFDLSKTLAQFQPNINLHIYPFAEFQKQVVMKIPSKYRMLITRRIFNKIAEKKAKEINCLALATGDSLGQVASQTLENLTTVYAATDLLKLSPLIGTNKKDIISLAKKIGTFDISSRPYEDCCSLFVAKHPEIRSELKTILKLEQCIDFSELDKNPLISYHISCN